MLVNGRRIIVRDAKTGEDITSEKQVGNYGESFDRNVGTGSKLGISRGLNRLWTKGGIQYAPPIR
jgi:hypothetical protein